MQKFPLLRLAYECQEAGGSATCTLNAADEIAVEAFLQEKIGFLGIHEVVSECLVEDARPLAPVGGGSAGD